MVAHAIRKHLSVEPTITRGGLFEEALKTVIEAVEDRQSSDVRSLLKVALQSRVIESEGGTIEVIPPWVE